MYLQVAEPLWRTIAWFTLVWFAASGLSLIVLQLLLPRAWEAIRAAPPSGPPWAQFLWYRRGRVYGATMIFAILLGGLAALLYRFF